MESESIDSPDMSNAEFAKALERVSDWIVSYRTRVGGLPVLSRIQPGDIEKALPSSAPLEGEPVEAWLKDLEDIILPGVTHWNHPGFMAYFGITGSAPGILAELIGGAINTNGMLWKTCPALAELERVVLRWYATALGLPDWFGMITDTASTSTLVALAAAREATGLDVRQEGLSGKPPLALYCSEEAHSSVDKAGLVLGVGMQGIRRIPSSEAFRMHVDQLEAAIEKDRQDGKHPFAVVATVGTTSATAVDPVREIAAVCRRHGLWLHVDAAYAGSAAVAPEFRWTLDGCDQADSLVVNPHKWLFTPIDCSALFTSRPDIFRNAFSLVPEYLRTDVRGAVDLMDYSFQLGRRFRALKLWFVFRHFGTRGIAARIREHVRLAQELTSWIDAHPQLERLAPAPFSVVCFRVHPAGMEEEPDLERLNASVLQKVNATGEVFLSHTKLKGRYCLRVAIGNLQTNLERVRRAYRLVCEAAGIPATGI
ncbi:MAG: amino acid decarboxylase [Acidobacteria bacterium]|nr:amino acid decarboxylase [Acidobacteriota bacterium]